MRVLRQGDWHYVPGDRVVVTHFGHIPVCSQRAPRQGAFCVQQIGEHEWTLAPARFEGLYAVRAAYDTQGRYEEFIFLRNAPDEMKELFDVMDPPRARQG